MSSLPVYRVEFIPLEHRLRDRRTAPSGTALPEGIAVCRRITDRRAEDRKTAHLSVCVNEASK
jgi:hypothetical protein